MIVVKMVVSLCTNGLGNKYGTKKRAMCATCITIIKLTIAQQKHK